MLMGGSPLTGIASIDAAGRQMMSERDPSPLSFSGTENMFRRVGMDEDAIQAIRKNWMGSGTAA